MKFEIKNRWDGSVIFTAEIECSEGAGYSTKLGLAIKSAVKVKACLRSADLSGAYLSGAGLRSADLRSADLSGAYLRSAYLRSADLSGAYLSGADLRSADLRSADLSGAYLRSADLSGAYLSGADLRSADLSGADLSGAGLRSADLSGAKGSELAIAKTRILAEGSLIGWKKCQSNVLVKLRIPEEARRSHAFGRKCRAEFVDVLEVIGADVGLSNHDYGKTQYRTGERVTCDRWEEDWRQECAGGIHFFVTREEAEDWL